MVRNIPGKDEDVKFSSLFLNDIARRYVVLGKIQNKTNKSLTNCHILINILGIRDLLRPVQFIFLSRPQTLQCPFMTVLYSWFYLLDFLNTLSSAALLI